MIFHIKFICVVSFFHIYIILEMEGHNYLPELGVLIMIAVLRFFFFGFNIPFIPLKIMENTKELLFMCTLAIKIYHIRNLNLHLLQVKINNIFFLKNNYIFQRIVKGAELFYIFIKFFNVG